MNFKKSFIYCTILLSFLLNNFSIFYAENETQEKNTPAETQSEKQNTSSEVPKDSDPLEIVAESAILIDADTGIVLYEKHPDKKLYPASITKILTSLLTIENCELNEKIKHSHEAIFGIGPGSSHIGMRENEEITVEQALHGILLASANEVCVAVAERIGGNVENFMKMANERAKKIGAVNTHFTNPHGFHDDNHYTTARDMALIMREAIKNKTFVKIISTYTYTIPPTNIVNEERILHNSNKLINPYSGFYYKNCVGGKTGFTDQAGNTLVTYCEKNGMNLISVVMKDQGTNTYSDSKKLMEYGFGLFEEKELFSKEDYVNITYAVQFFKDKKIELKKVSAIPKESFSAVVPKNLNKANIQTKANLPDEITLEAGKTLQIGDKIGTLDIVYKNGNLEETLARIDLISNSKVDSFSEEELQRKEDMRIFWNKTITILIITGIAIAVIGITTVSVILFKKHKAKKDSPHF